MIFAVVVIAILMIGAIKTDVPAHLQGSLVIQGRIVDCDFQQIGRRGGDFFMGIRLDEPAAPYLRFNGRRSERSVYEALCARKPTVRVTYHAVKRIIGPVRFWIDDVVEG
ncbi:hypothetical protein [Pseudoxanthomonas sp. PXM02]|uniref:hypothetical protein n=1 Tax=Pseudoxanthomonas sp. PXM02 TaxID=2769294 RepID=UPI001785D7AB|nr:hypothetical protein [Pseudoxanthomonas sp. PXM02]MBD9480507.1 hypothetical protein [Pseudoxanthomonas sp. PXM02]